MNHTHSQYIVALDASFPENQFYIDGFSKPYRLDRNIHGGGVMIYIRKDIPSKELKNHNFAKMWKLFS